MADVQAYDVGTNLVAPHVIVLNWKFERIF
jgi:hypothetical protein